MQVGAGICVPHCAFRHALALRGVRHELVPWFDAGEAMTVFALPAGMVSGESPEQGESLPCHETPAGGEFDSHGAVRHGAERRVV